MAERFEPYHVFTEGRGQEVVINPLLVTHMTRSGNDRCEVYFVSGTSLTIQGELREVAAALFAPPGAG